MNIPLALDLCLMGLIILTFAIIFAVRKEKACKLLADLERADLIERRRQGLTKPSITYVKYNGPVNPDQ